MLLYYLHTNLNWFAFIIDYNLFAISVILVTGTCYLLHYLHSL